MTDKFCLQCRHMKWPWPWSNPWCQLAANATREPVFGNPQIKVACAVERASGTCGPDANNFSPE